MKPLAVLLRDVAAPVLRAKGFRRSAGTFRKVTPSGVAVIQVSGRGGIGLTDVDFHVEVGFTRTEDLTASTPPERVVVALGVSTWQTRLDDPAIEAPMSQKWRFNLDNTVATTCFGAVLEQAAEDVPARLDAWPAVPQDSLSRPPVFRGRVVPGERPEHQAWLDRIHASLRQGG